MQSSQALGRPKLSQPVVAALDAVRAFAAVYVVIHHLAHTYLINNKIEILTRFGQEAVMVFFILSGFVIFANEHYRIDKPEPYFGRRARRIYPALIVAIVLSTIVALWNGDLAQRFDLGELAATLLNLQDVSALKPGVISNAYLGNQPLWSLSYEIAFYIAFPFIMVRWRRAPNLTTHAIGAACCLAYVSFALLPNHFSLVAAYFLIWWAGAMAANAYLDGRRTLGAIRAPLLWLATLCIVAAGAVALHQGGRQMPGVYPYLPLRHFVTALLLLVVFFGPVGKWAANIFAVIPAPFAVVASISYGLYIFHYPLLVQWSFAHSAFGFVVALALLIALSFAADRMLNNALAKAAWARPRLQKTAEV